MVIPPLSEVLTQWLGRFRRRGAPARSVGLDIGSASIKLVELEHRAGQRPRVVKHLIQELPIAIDGPHPEARTALADWLHGALKEFQASDVHVAIGGHEVAVRRVDVPMMSRGELREAVRWQVKDQLPFAVQNAVLDLAIVGDVWDKDIKKQDVLVAACSSAAVRELIELVQRAGGRVASVLPSPLACWAGASLSAQGVRGTLALIEIGSQATHATIVKDGQVRVTRELAIGSRSLTDALVGVVSSDHGDRAIDTPLAEALKRRYGVLGESAEGNSEEGVPLFHVASLMRPVLEQLLTEISRFLDFYRVQMDAGGASRVLLCGGGAILRGLPEFLSQGLGVPVELVNPLGILEHGRTLEPEQLAEDGPRLVTALGLAAEHGARINLLPSQLPHACAPVSSTLWIPVAKTCAALMAAAGLSLQAATLIVQRRVDQRRAEWASLEAPYQQAMVKATQHAAMERAAERIEQFLQQQPVWDGLLKELGRLTPSGVELERLAIEPHEPGMRLYLQGRAAAGTAGKGGLAQFVEGLERSSFIADAQLVSSEMRSNDRTRFEIEALLE